MHHFQILVTDIYIFSALKNYNYSKTEGMYIMHNSFDLLKKSYRLECTYP